MTWVTLHEVTHAVQFAGVPWLQRPPRRAACASCSRAPRCGSTRRASCGCRRREEIARVIANALRHGDLISIVTSPAERATLDRVQAVMAVIEGHAEHVMDAVAPDLLPSLPKLRAAIDRRRKSQSGLCAAGRAAARPRAEAAPVRAGQALLRRGRQAGRRRGAAPRVLGPGGAADARRARGSRRAWLARTRGDGSAQRASA